MNKYKYIIKSVLWCCPREIITDQNTAELVFTALCDFYGIDQDEMVGVYYEKGEFVSASAEFDINGKRHKITIKRDGDGNTL